MTFQDHFSKRAHKYAEFRPDYPAALFQELASLTEKHFVAWDCATGNGQAAEQLANHFRFVIASDGSKKQLQQRRILDRIGYCAALAENPPLKNNSADLITVAQALHWLKTDRFFEAVQRILKPRGIIAVWCYNLMEIEPAIDRILMRFYTDIVGPYWAPERKLLEEGYRTITFPFEELPPPAVSMTKEWNLDDIFGYLDTWSSTQKFVEVKESDPIDEIRADLQSAWGEAEKTKTIHWPLSLRIGRKHQQK